MYSESWKVLEAVGRRLGVSVGDAELLHLHSNASYLLPSTGWVVRIATNPDAIDRVAQSLRVTRWLAERGYPCVVPVDLAGQPFVEAGRVVSVWQYLPTAVGPPPSGADLGELLHRLHGEPSPPAWRPALMTDPLVSVTGAIEQVPQAVSTEQRQWLQSEIDRLRAAWQRIEFPHPSSLIHGDAHPGNLLRTTDGLVVLGDWDHVALGPREWDLAQIHYTHRRFAARPAGELDEFAAAYGWDVRAWPGLPTLIEVREISGLSAFIRTATTKPSSRDELLHRIRTLQRGDSGARWRRPKS